MERSADSQQANFLSPLARLLVASATALFLELACIRWAGSHVLYLSYVSNLLLITAFLGLGLGNLLAAGAAPRALERLIASGPLLLLAFVAAVAFSGFAVQIDGGEVIYFGNAVLQNPLPAWAVLPLLGLLMTATFASLGVVIGCELAAAAPLTTYSVDVAGSLLGVLLFALVSLLEWAAQLWFGAVLLGFLLLMPRRKWPVLSSALAAVALLTIVVWTDFESAWSPYQRVSIQPLPAARPRAEHDPTAGTPSYRLHVNNVVHQYISDVRRREPFYEFPYRAAGAQLPGGEAYLTALPPHADWEHDPFHPRAHAWGGSVAIIGAGNGTDTAAALAYGAAQVDAVEIDPLLARVGKQLQPNHAFLDPRVRVHVMDGRTFLERAQTRYDLIVFGLPDSLTLASPYASVRLESFLFTEEAFRRALARLEPARGLLVVYNYYRKPWLVARIAGTLARAMDGKMPRVLVGPDRNLSAVFIAGPGLSRVDPALGRDWGFRIEKNLPDVGVASDDWPFLYLRDHAVPDQIALALGVLVLFSTLAIALVFRRAARAETRKGTALPRLRELAPFFAMGVAFLLLETSGLVRMSLLFGATWFVNALVFASVLVMVLLANLLLRLVRPRRNVVFTLLLGSLLLAFFLPPASFAALASGPKYFFSSCVLFVPILLANFAFSGAFSRSAWPAAAFGANLLGAVIGGALENLALVTGHSALLLVAGLLYIGAWVSGAATAGVNPSPRNV